MREESGDGGQDGKEKDRRKHSKQEILFVFMCPEPNQFSGTTGKINMEKYSSGHM